MKIQRVKPNNHKKAFEVTTDKKTYLFPYAKLDLQPSPSNPLVSVAVDSELGDEAFTYIVASGDEGTVHIDHVLDYNQDPGYLRDVLLYRLTLEVQKRVANSPLSKRELMRRLGTSATQFYRLLDQTNYQKSFGQLFSLLHVLDCDVDLVVKERVPKSA